MPRFYFDVHDGARVIADVEGQVLPSVDDALAKGQAIARRERQERLDKGAELGGQDVVVLGEDGEHVAVFSLTSAIFSGG